MQVRALPTDLRPIAVRLDPGEELFPALERIATDHGIVGGFVPLGIGSLREATLGYFDGEQYVKRTFPEPLELVSLSGSIARSEGRPSFHLHATLGDRQLGTFGGHLFGGTVEILAEVLLLSTSIDFGRDPRGPLLKVLNLDPHPRP